MGSVSLGAPYAGSGRKMFELTLDHPTPEDRQRLIADAVMERVPSRPIPTSFIAWTDGSARASVVFGDGLSDEELSDGLDLLLSRLVELGCLGKVPPLPDPLYA